MRRTLPLLAMALLLALAPVSEASTLCDAPGSTTVAENSAARVFAKGSPGAERLRGCSFFGDGSTLLLAKNFDDGLYESGTWDRVRLYRRFASWRYTRVDTSCKADCPPDYGHWETLTVRDLVTGKRRRRPASFALGKSFVLTRSRVLVTAVERDGAVELATWDGEEAGALDSGEIEARSLRARGNRVTWVKAGVRRSADLPR